jgi:plasmid stability protein
MKRTIISLPDDLHRRLRVMAAEDGTSVAAIIREAIERRLGTERKIPKSLGAGSSGYTDTSTTIAIEPVPPYEWR